MKINGVQYSIDKENLGNFLESLGYLEEYIVIELNGEIIQKEKIYDYTITDADKIEVVSFVGGG